MLGCIAHYLFTSVLSTCSPASWVRLQAGQQLTRVGFQFNIALGPVTDTAIKRPIFTYPRARECMGSADNCILGSTTRASSLNSCDYY